MTPDYDEHDKGLNALDILWYAAMIDNSRIQVHVH